MQRIVIALLTLFYFACASIEDEVFVESLAANIENEGLLTNFPQAWKHHIDLWSAFQQLAVENETAVHNASWPRNETWPHGEPWTHSNESWPQNGTWPMSATFNCNVTGDESPSEHTIDRLHPKHIGVVAALGASIMAGTGANATRLLETVVQYRGLSFAIGGDGSLNDTITLPNILKEYNSKLRGYSRRIAPVWYEDLSHFNVAVPGATANDLEDQAKELIKRIDQWPGARDEWKVVTVFIGLNDLCEACDKRVGGRASSFGRQIASALDRLHKGLSRTLVNLVALPPLHQWYRQLHDDPVCWALHRYLCPCISNYRSDSIAKDYNNELYTLARQYDTADFAVVVQPFMSGAVEFPKVTIDGKTKTDQSLFAPDCFHLSRRGHAAAARALWQNMFQAIGEKTSTLSIPGDGDQLTCPDDAFPYVRTNRNSNVKSTVRLSRQHSHGENMSEDMWEHDPNATHAHHHDNISDSQRLKPWHRSVIRLVQIPFGPGSPTSTPAASAGWILFGVLLAVAVVGTAVIGFVDMKRRGAGQGRQGRRYRDGERQPLLMTGSNVEQAF